MKLAALFVLVATLAVVVLENQSGFAGGLSGEFAKLARRFQMDSWLRLHCNETVRSAGVKAYKKRIDVRKFVATSNVSFCNYGFLIGYLEALFDAGGSLSQAKRFCLFIKKTNQSAAHAYLECLKGIGTAAGADVCEAVTKNETELNICVVGAMNKLAEQVSFARPGLAKLSEDCGLVTEKYRPQCYGSMAGMLIWSGRESFESALSLAQNIPDRQGQIRAVRIIAKIAKNKVNKDEALVAGCRNLPEHLSNQCFISLVQGSVELGTPGREWESGLVFCNESFLTLSEQELCRRFVLYETETVFGGRSVVEIICRGKTDLPAAVCREYNLDYFSL